MAKYGRMLPSASSASSSQLYAINMMDMRDELASTDYTHLAIRLPPATGSTKSLVVRLDWYVKETRTSRVDLATLEMFVLATKRRLAVRPTTRGHIFQRFYLTSFTGLYQAFTLHAENRAQKARNTLHVLFDENLSPTSHHRHVHHWHSMMTSPALQNSKTPSRHQHQQATFKNLSLVLTRQNRRADDRMPYIDVILDLEQKSAEELAAAAATLIIEIDRTAMIAQFVRFHLLFVPAFVAFLLQFYDYLSMTSVKRNPFRQSE